MPYFSHGCKRLVVARAVTPRGVRKAHTTHRGTECTISTFIGTGNVMKLQFVPRSKHRLDYNKTGNVRGVLISP